MGKRKGKPNSKLKWSKPHRLPEHLEKEVDQTIADYPEHGYTGPAEFIRDAVREKIHRIKAPKTNAKQPVEVSA